ncbi:hypothetical protein RO3G_06859 [Lichtheimia corymbifera JMRC:FSU:9682]|uniref:Pentacotripeptide-repeat region of PRORP domain-containing protein n=1 Tax=Lichtheimia corymbifera JMRC:FSU:9682 TaxID=1263082 RepID=A0A068RGZ0_9FUNG|nr:hypothetical protein RO3G_06859 [Lichtheimia corymbifera JMRC:FSU:9682]
MFNSRHAMLFRATARIAMQPRMTATTLPFRMTHSASSLRLRPVESPTVAKATRSFRDAVRKKNQAAVWNTYNTLLNDKVKVPKGYHALALQSFRLKALVAYGPEEIETVKQRLLFVLNEMEKDNVPLDIRDYNHLFEFFGRTGDWEACTRYWNEMQARCAEDAAHGPSLSALLPTAYTYNLYMRAAIASGRSDQVFGILKDMRNAGIQPNVFTVDTLIEAHGQLDDLKGVERVFRDAFEKKDVVKKKNKKSFSFWTLNTTAPDTLTRHVRQQLMPKQPRMKPTPHTFAALIDAYGRQRQLDEINQIYRQMLPKYNVQPTLAVYNSMIRWYCQYSQLDRARRLFYDMERADIKPNLSTFNYIFRHEALREKNPWRAEALLDMMRKIYDLQPVQSMYRALIKVYNRKNKEDDADRLFQVYMAVKESSSSPLSSPSSSSSTTITSYSSSSSRQ